jgi:hypothetical protein
MACCGHVHNNNPVKANPVPKSLSECATDVASSIIAAMLSCHLLLAARCTGLCDLWHATARHTRPGHSTLGDAFVESVLVGTFNSHVLFTLFLALFI